MDSSLFSAGEIDLSNTTFAQWSSLKENLDMEIEQLSIALCDLNKAKHTTEVGLENLKKFEQPSLITKSSCLVPLTGKIFVRGTVEDLDTFLVDFGSGHWAELPIKDAREFYLKKLQSIKERMELVQAAAQDKVFKRDGLIKAISNKVKEAIGPEGEVL